MKEILFILTIITGLVVALQLWEDGHRMSAIWAIYSSFTLAIIKYL